MPQIPLGTGAYKRDLGFQPEVLLPSSSFRPNALNRIFDRGAMNNYPAPKNVFAYPYIGRQVLHAAYEVPVFIYGVSPGITRLLLLRAPAAVFGGVTLGIINSIYRGIFWPFAHIINKIPKSSRRPVSNIPSIANADAAPAVMRPSWIIRIITPSTHLRPKFIERVVFCLSAIHAAVMVQFLSTIKG